MKRIALAALAAISMVGPVRADAFSSVERIRAICVEDLPCSTFVAGATDAYSDAQAAISADLGTPFLGYCLPKRIELGELVKVFREHISSPSVAGNTSAASELFIALQRKWPCSG